MEKQFQIPRPFCQCQLFRLHSNQQEQSSGTEERKLVRICLFFVSLQKGKKLTRQDWSWTEDRARGADYERRLKQWSRELSLRFSNLKFSRDCADNFLAACSSSNPGHNSSCSRHDGLEKSWKPMTIEWMWGYESYDAGELTAGRQYISLRFWSTFKLKFNLKFKFNIVTLEWFGGCMLAGSVRGLAGDISRVFVFRSTF